MSLTDYTASSAFFDALWQAGVRYCFANLGSDHPAIIEAFVKGQNEKRPQPQIVTCPNEMVALAMADGYARITRRPQCVIVHVDVGTQNLGSAVHDAATGRVPVLIFAGLSPYTIEGEARGSRTEYIHWLQDVHDQRQIVSQYCRYTGEIKDGRAIKQMVNRALSFAKSSPQGPVYLVGAREVMEQEIEPYTINQAYWEPVEPSALPPAGVSRIAEALAHAQTPLCIVGASGRNHTAVSELLHLADAVKGIQVLDTAGSDMSFPADHPAWLGMRYGVEPAIESADVILVLECDVPWIPTRCRPRGDAIIFHIDTDPLKELMPVFYINAVARYQADAATALTQLNSHLDQSQSLQNILTSERVRVRWKSLQDSHAARLNTIRDLAVASANGTFNVSYLVSRVRALCPKETTFVIEAVTNASLVADQIQATIPGSWINCGGGGLGWSGGAALGIKLAAEDYATPDGPRPFVCQIVGDGTFLFSVPSSVAWIAQRYRLPVLTIVLNNAGWNAPRNSAQLVHPTGHASKATNEDLKISFAPSPDYAGVAVAGSGGWCWGGRAKDAEELEKVLAEAVAVVKGGRGAVVDAQLEGGQGGFGAGIEGQQAG